MRPVENFYLNKEEPVKGCLFALRDLILQQNDAVTETVKYGMPCFCFRKKPFCYLWTDKKTREPYLLLVEGKHLDHPQLERGNRSRMKILRVDPNADLQVDSIHLILTDALNLYREGKIKT